MPDIHKHQTPEMDECIHHCEAAHDICLHEIHDCLKKGGEHANAEHIGLMMDCAAICDATEDAMLRHSSVHAAFCQACATVCEACAASCEKMGDTDCAEACRACAKSCQQMAAMNTHTH